MLPTEKAEAIQEAFPLMPWNLWIHLHLYHHSHYSYAWENCFILSNTYPSTCAFNSIFFLLMQFMFKLMPFSLSPQHPSSYSLLSNYSETCSWIFYGHRNFSLSSPVSLCFICLLPFSDYHWSRPPRLLVCIPLPLTHFEVHSRSRCTLPAPQKLVIPRSQVPPLDTFWCVFFFAPFIEFSIFYFDQDPLSNTCLLRHYNICFLLYFYSHIFSFSFVLGALGITSR